MSRFADNLGPAPNGRRCGRYSGTTTPDPTMAEKFATMTAAIPVWRSIARAPRLAGRGLVLMYRYTLSPLLGFHCRHLPTCSEYADTALARFVLWAGGWMTLAR